MHYAIINDEGVCTGTAHLKKEENFPGYIPDDNPESRMGMKWTGTEWEEHTPEPKYKYVLSKYEFSQRFTLEEKVAIRQAAKNDVTLEVIIEDFAIAAHVDLQLPAVQDYLGYLVSQGLLTQERANEVATPEIM